MFGTSVAEVAVAGRVAWVSGASSGLGRAAAMALKASGWRVVSGARSYEDTQREGETGYALKLDVCDPDSVAAFAEKAAALYGAPDALVCAAGVLTLGPAEDVTEAELRAVMDTVLLGSLRMARAALPLMRKAGGGKIALFSSVYGRLGAPFHSAYGAAKHALEALGESLAMETRGQGIQVTIVEPGDHRGGQARYRARAAQVQPLYRESLGRVADVIARDEAGGQWPEDFGRKFARLMNRRKMPLRKRFTKPLEDLAILAHGVLPGRLFLFLYSKYYRV